MNGCTHRYIYIWGDSDLPSCTLCGQTVLAATGVAIDPPDNIRAGRYIADLAYYSLKLKFNGDLESYQALLDIFGKIAHHAEPSVAFKPGKLSPERIEAYRQKMKAMHVIRKDDRYMWRY